MTEWKVGDVRIVKVVEHEMAIPLNGGLLEAFPPELVGRHDWLQPEFVDGEGNAKLSIHGLVIDSGDRRILVDTCMGDNRAVGAVPAMPSTFLEDLAAAGYAVDDIDTVVCTHLHFDHVGWNTRLVDGAWEVTFPKARYLFARVEWEHWQVTDHEYLNVNDTVRPVVEQGYADLVETDHRVCDEVYFVPTPGHTPGHVSVVIESGGERAVITGDMTHHPIQLAEPELGMGADSDHDQGVATRRTFVADRLADGALVIGTHYGGRTAGHVTRDGEKIRFG